MIKINGEGLAIAEIRLVDYLAENGYDKRAIAIELNEEILPKDRYPETVLKDGDVLEIVHFMGGGSI